MDEQKPAKVVVSGGGLGRKGFRGFMSDRKVQIGTAVIIVLLAAAAGYWYLRPVSSKKLTHTNVAPTSLDPVSVQYVQMSNDDILRKVSYLMGTRQYAEAEKLLGMQNDINTNAVKLQLLANVQAQNNQKNDAAKTAEKMTGLSNLEPGQYEFIGDQFAAVGNKAEAKLYYQKALDAYSASPAGPIEANTSSLEGKIKELSK